MAQVFYRIIFISILISTLHCGGSVSLNAPQSNTTTSISGNTSDALSGIYVFATNFQSPGLLYKAFFQDDQIQLISTGVTPLGTEAVIRYNQDKVFVLHAGGNFNSVSSDNLQAIDPFNASFPFKTTSQFSLGNSVNPVGLSFYQSDALISLYNPQANPDYQMGNGYADVVRVNQSTGELTASFSFYDDLDDDGDRHANASCSVIHGALLYVCLQDLDSTNLKAVSSGKIGIIDLNTNTIVDVIELQGRNPFDLALSPDGDFLFVTLVDDFDSNTPFGGLEILNRTTGASLGFISEEDLGGYVEKVQVSNNQVFVVVSRSNLSNFTFESKIVVMNLNDRTGVTARSLFDFEDDIRAFQIENNHLWVASRQISTADGTSNAQLFVLELTTGELLDSVDLTAPGFSITAFEENN